MFKLVVLSALFVAALAAPKPSGLLYGGALAYSVPSAVAVPTAVSHQSRVDVISKPVVATSYAAAAPVVVEAAPIVKSVPTIVEAAPAVAVPTAVSHQSRVDVISKPVVATTYSVAPQAVAVAQPQQVIVQQAQPQVLWQQAVPQQVLAYNAVPSAVSHQSRVDLVNQPIIAQYAAQYPVHAPSVLVNSVW